MRVLIVDDYPDTVEIASDLLRSQGHDCRTALCGAEAIAAAEAFSPEVAILDIGLPDIDGCELASDLRSRFEDDPPYLIAISGWPHTMERARAAGFDQWIMKPAGRDQLLHAVELAQRHHAARWTARKLETEQPD
jgi:DNA-binding response OmpR family regulator